MFYLRRIFAYRYLAVKKKSAGTMNKKMEEFERAKMSKWAKMLSIYSVQAITAMFKPKVTVMKVLLSKFFIERLHGFSGAISPELILSSSLLDEFSLFY